MMTKLFKVLFVIFVITVFPAKAKESFNGIIKYSIVVQSLSEHLSHELLTQTYGAETTVYYGQGLYRIDSEGGMENGRYTVQM